MKLTKCKINGLNVSTIKYENGVLIAEAALDVDGALVGTFPLMVAPDKAVAKALTALITAIEKQFSVSLGDAASGEDQAEDDKPQPLFEGV
jgi:hypothetical protein